MNYIDPSEYKDLLNKFAKGTKKGMLKEGYIDLMPINSLSEEKPTAMGKTLDMSANYAKYPEAMEEKKDVANPGKYAGGPRASFDKDGDGVPDGADKSPMDGSKHENLHLGMVTDGRNLENLSIDERTQLKEYIKSMKTIKGAIDELLNKAKGAQMEGGDMSSGILQTGE